MADAYITEYSELARDALDYTIQAGKEPGIFQKVTFTTSTQSAAFGNETRFIRLVSDTDCYIEFGVNPTAVNVTDTLVKANTPEFFGVIPGQKVALVT